MFINMVFFVFLIVELEERKRIRVVMVGCKLFWVGVILIKVNLFSYLGVCNFFYWKYLLCVLRIFFCFLGVFDIRGVLF